MAILAHTDLAGAEETARRCRAAGRRTLVVRADVRRSDEVRHAVDEVVRSLGRLDILVNNAGALGAQLNVPLLELDEATWHLMMDSHLTGTFLCLKHAAPHMVRQRLGPGRQHLVDPRPHRRTAHARALRRRQGGRHRAHPHRRAGAGPPRRHGQRRLAGLRRHRAPRAARSPGSASTRSRSRFPVGRIGKPAEIAAAVVFLASDGAAFVNGAVLDINGGRMEYV